DIARSGWKSGNFKQTLKETDMIANVKAALMACVLATGIVGTTAAEGAVATYNFNDTTSEAAYLASSGGSANATVSAISGAGGIHLDYPSPNKTVGSVAGVVLPVKNILTTGGRDTAKWFQFTVTPAAGYEL